MSALKFKHFNAEDRQSKNVVFGWLTPLCAAQNPDGFCIENDFVIYTWILSANRKFPLPGNLDYCQGLHYFSRMLSLIVYIALIAGVNWAFAITPPMELPNGDLWSPVALIVGFVFVVRDFAQRRIGHNILWAMLAGCAISWWMASPALAIASALAFALGELADWAMFTFTKRPFSQRILISSLLGAPLDSLVFLTIIDLATPLGVAAMSLSKLFGALLVFYLVRRREQLAPEAA